jgi:TonB-linked SusC/RagA family outer membrane protein
MLSAAPTLTPYKDDGTYRLLNTEYPFNGSIENPLGLVKETSNKSHSNSVMANLAFTFKPIDGLSIKISGNVLNVDSRMDGYVTKKYLSSSGSAQINTGQGLSLNSDNIITYNKTINEIHKINVMGGVTYEQYTYASVGASGTGFLSDNFETYNIGSATTLGIPSSSYLKWQLLSYLGRINYSLKDKYLVTVSLRSDGSSRYSVGNKWGSFPSGALAWRVSDEDFMKSIRVISSLKLRAGYGETGSTAIDPYSTLSMLSSGKAVFDKTLYTYLAPSTTYPGNLKWETTAQTDIGLDIAFFKDRLRFTADYYIKNTRDLLNSVQMPVSTGYTTTIQNVGKIQNKGFEFQMDVVLLDKKFKWDISSSISFNRNKVVKLYNGQDITGGILGITIIQDYVNLLREGQPLGIFYGYQENGYDETGKITYKDIDGVPGITAADKTYIGNPNPKFIYSLNSSMSYKNFVLSWFIQGTYGNDIYSLSLASQTFDYGQGLNSLREVLYNNWTQDNPNAKYPKISTTSSYVLMSDRFVYDGSYMRLKNIELAYSFPVDKFGIQWLKKGQIYVSGQNLLTITSYPWWDPDVNSRGGSSSLLQGIDHFTYPTAKGATFGIRLSF